MWLRPDTEVINHDQSRVPEDHNMAYYRMVGVGIGGQSTVEVTIHANTHGTIQLFAILSNVMFVMLGSVAALAEC